jgi:hypothetical protein
MINAISAICGPHWLPALLVYIALMAIAWDITR